MSSSWRAFAVILVVLAFAHRTAAAESLSGTLELDPAKTLVEFRLPGALHATHGKFKLAHGTIRADLATGEASGSIVIDASSGDSGLAARDDRMKANVLEVQKYPDITFTPRHAIGKLEKDGHFQAKLDGVLTIHGARHEVITEVQGRLVGDSLAAACHFSVPYVDWGMRDPSLFFLTVAKQVEIDIATEGRITWPHRDKVASHP
jgi:polyisoprenoid-binding protein YceI